MLSSEGGGIGHVGLRVSTAKFLVEKKVTVGDKRRQGTRGRVRPSITITRSRR